MVGMVESCIGGGIGVVIIFVFGLFVYYEGSVVIYLYCFKEELLGVE